MTVATIPELRWRSLTGVVDQMKPASNFLTQLLYPVEDPKSTETIDLSVVISGREMAPFVKVNGEGVLVSGTTKKFQTVQPANIRIKQPFTPSQLLYDREPGTAIYVTNPASQRAAIRRHIARDLQYMENLIQNRIEWMVAQTLRGAIDYEGDHDVFTITIPRSASFDIASVTPYWDDSTPADVDILGLVDAVKELMGENEGLAPTDAIMGTLANDSFRKVNLVQKLTDIGRTEVGDLNFASQFQASGAQYRGTFGGIRWWYYPRQLTNEDGTATSLIRSQYVEFVHVGPAAERVLYYGAIPDMDALDGGSFVGRRFAKSWRVEDPSAVMALVHTRPLPWPRRPNASVSVKVVEAES